MTTSSSEIKQRLQASQWRSAPWYDIYSRPVGECHPNYIAQTIGGPQGPKICIRKRNIDGSDPTVVGVKLSKMGEPAFPIIPWEINPKTGNPYGRSYGIYSVGGPTQETNTLTLAGRQVPHKAFLEEHNYIRRQIPYNGTGIPGTVDTTAISSHEPFTYLPATTLKDGEKVCGAPIGWNKYSLYNYHVPDYSLGAFERLAPKN